MSINKTICVWLHFNYITRVHRFIPIHSVCATETIKGHAIIASIRSSSFSYCPPPPTPTIKYIIIITKGTRKGFAWAKGGFDGQWKWYWFKDLLKTNCGHLSCNQGSRFNNEKYSSLPHFPCSANSAASPLSGRARYPRICWSTATPARIPASTAASGSTKSRTWRSTPTYTQVSIPGIQDNWMPNYYDGRILLGGICNYDYLINGMR